ncbi:hypothetical protein [Paraliomyxa miuraensis]|uniref:hypothetical protein n=1 Tax=Paraliomyxa miuraensis TaxID=376150 RepID=UPI0022554D99|nr:hypothetical protein [Paraliomyxa miuraensis]MCX4244550.1 hypothetical protein [Paraliomyxa miuraensis]
MRRLASIVVRAGVALTLAAAPAHAATGARGVGPAAPAPRAPVVVPDDDEEAVELAEAAWSRGGWTEVREVLEPVAADPSRLQDSRLREKALALLADATVNDPALDESERRVQAGEYLERLLDADPGWRLPPAIYSPELFELFVEVQDQRSQRASAQCEADRMACEADLADNAADLEDLRRRHADLEQKYDDQEVEVRDRVARSRVFAAIPAGIGHFYNGEPVLGGVFLGAEAVLGATGLGLILVRKVVDGCDRTDGFERGSLECAAGRDLDAILRRRKAEEVVGWLFLGTIALDIFLAQYRFRPYKTQSVGRVPRKELDAEGGGGDERRRRERKPRAKVRPTGAGGRGGLHLGIRVEF